MRATTSHDRRIRKQTSLNTSETASLSTIKQPASSNRELAPSEISSQRVLAIPQPNQTTVMEVSSSSKHNLADLITYGQAEMLDTQSRLDHSPDDSKDGQSVPAKSSAGIANRRGTAGSTSTRAVIHLKTTPLQLNMDSFPVYGSKTRLDPRKDYLETEVGEFKKNNRTAIETQDTDSSQRLS